ncbi:MAG: UDP-N-acetylmuramoyl-L-alanyl-D-glutamate--2,6-diaminopimelate ligase [Alphaproteobacteria bacterium GWF2_58_20]|nr:MAG: UDP-N-acetylmuramoyl-L-alanyl-D-glutamate--2,6-diaminopimelate ligase [Alphaproteobacteria bacterium GWF2_58_20]
MLSFNHEIPLSGITSDSRAVKPGFLFAALTGAKADGRTYIQAALDAGAIAILAPDGTTLPEGARATLITDPDARRAFAHLAATFYPAQPATLVAVTGTNGKTSTVQFCEQLWTAIGFPAASVGTLGISAPGGLGASGTHTTPDPVKLHETLDRLTRHGVNHLAMEASSHGLDQRRLDGVRLTAAAFTNLTRDHLDYHQTMEAYAVAKNRLFSEILPENATAVINADSPASPHILETCRLRGIRVLTFGKKGLDLRLVHTVPHPAGQHLDIEVFGRPYSIDVPVAGVFQASNILAALGLILSDETLSPGDVIPKLGQLRGVRGRIELAATHPSGAPVYVDYAHTPDALETLLNALRPHTSGRLAVVFGCGGDRDRGKRPMMGEIANRLADIVLVTDDNPRSENPAPIRQEILAACPGAIEMGDRAEAIRHAVSLLETGDVLVIAGKGHEQGQIIGNTIRPFDDASEVRAALKEQETP